MEAMARNTKNRWVYPLAPTARGYTTLEGYSVKMGNYDLVSIGAHADFDSILDVRRVSTSKQERRRNRINYVESAIAHMEDTFTSCSKKAVNMFARNDMADGGKYCVIRKGLKN